MRIIVVLLLVGAASYACSSSSAPPKSSPLASVKIISGDSQTGSVGAALSSAIAIQALDSNGHPAVGLTVLFEPVTDSDGSVANLSDTTDAMGKASTTWTLGTVRGREGLFATVLQGGSSNDVVTDTVYATANP